MDVQNTADRIFLKEAFVDKINENLVKTEDASKHVFKNIEVNDEKTVDL